jgi:RNA recognition motif-containing protein
MNIYVGNLSYGMSEDELRQAFSAFGEAEAAVAQLNGKDVGGRALRINEARPREQK